MRVIILKSMLCLATGSACLFANASHVALDDNSPLFTSAYTLIDIGETDLDPSLLAHSAKKLTLGPAINDEGVIIGNTSKGGFVTLPGKWMFAPEFQGMHINFHALNRNGDLLVALVRGQESVEWMCWPCQKDNYGTFREHIITIDPFTSKFYVTGFNEESQISAYGPTCDGSVRPLSWQKSLGLGRLGVGQDLDIKGIALGMNHSGAVVGVIDSVVDQAPFVWHPVCGLLVANNYRQYFDPSGWVEFADMLVSDDATVYGTYTIKHLADKYVMRGHYYETRQFNGSYYQYNAFKWSPASGQINMLDLGGMRLAKVNSNHVLVGSLLDNAAIRFSDKEPVLLASLIEPTELKDWKLLEITDINTQGQLVGYGLYQDKVHFFLANPLK